MAISPWNDSFEYVTLNNGLNPSAQVLSHQILCDCRIPEGRLTYLFSSQSKVNRLEYVILSYNSFINKNWARFTTLGSASLYKGYYGTGLKKINLFFFLGEGTLWPIAGLLKVSGFLLADLKMKRTWHFLVCEDLTSWWIVLQHRQHLLTLQSKLKPEEGRIQTVGGAVFCGLYLFAGYNNRSCPAWGCVSHRKIKRCTFGLGLCCVFCVWTRYCAV